MENTLRDITSIECVFPQELTKIAVVHSATSELHIQTFNKKEIEINLMRKIILNAVDEENKCTRYNYFNTNTIH